MTIIIAVLVIYMVAMVYIGVKGKKSQSMNDYLTAGGKNGGCLMA